MTNNNKRIAAIAATGITIVSPIAQTTTVFADEVDDAQTELKKAEEQAKAAIPRLEYIKPLLERLDEKKLPGSMVTLMQTLVYYFDYPEVDKERLAYSVEKYIYNALNCNSGKTNQPICLPNVLLD